jgi:hypothetical protein
MHIFLNHLLRETVFGEMCSYLKEMHSSLYSSLMVSKYSVFYNYIQHRPDVWVYLINCSQLSTEGFFSSLISSQKEKVQHLTKPVAHTILVVISGKNSHLP